MTSLDVEYSVRNLILPTVSFTCQTRMIDLIAYYRSIINGYGT